MNVFLPTLDTCNTPAPASVAALADVGERRTTLSAPTRKSVTAVVADPVAIVNEPTLLVLPSIMPRITWFCLRGTVSFGATVM